MAKVKIPTVPSTLAPILDTGNHILTGTASGDVLLITSNADNLFIDGGAGVDWLMFSDGAITFNMNISTEQNTGYGQHTVSNVENIITSANVAAPGQDLIIGSDVQNFILTFHGNDEISAGGGNDFIPSGTGNDTVTGGAGADYFCFTEKLNKRTNVDRITDFKHRSDEIVLAKYGYNENGIKFDLFAKAGPAGTLKSSAFYVGSKAHHKDDRIIYNQKTGALYYDPDGTGKAAQIQFATLTNKAKGIAATDFLIG